LTLLFPRTHKLPHGFAIGSCFPESFAGFRAGYLQHPYFRSLKTTGDFSFPFDRSDDGGSTPRNLGGAPFRQHRPA